MKTVAVLVLVLTALLTDVFSTPAMSQMSASSARASADRLLGKF